MNSTLGSNTKKELVIKLLMLLVVKANMSTCVAPILTSKVDASMHDVIREFIKKDPSAQAVLL